MIITHKFRLYPNKNQEEKLLWTLNKCRQTYNFLLSELQQQKVIDRSQIQGILPDLKICEPELKQVYAKTLQYEGYRLFSNLKSLSQSKKNNIKVGMLKFKNKKQFKTFNYNQYGFKLIKTEKRHQILHLSKIGEIPIRCHRNIKGNIKQITIKKESSEKWYALIIENKKEIKVQKQIKNKVGIDLGIINYIYDSKGNYFTSPICLENSLKKLRIERKKLSDKKQGSKNYIRQKIKVAKIYEKIVNQRKDFLHKISNYYTHNYDFIAIEKLSIKRMIKVSYNARNIYNASWFKFIKMLHYKSKKMGCIVINVSPYQTSQICSDCGEKVSKQIWHRNHICKCGLKINRDYNAAKMILKKALGQELSESTLVEMKAPPLLRQPPFMKQETPILSKE